MKFKILKIISIFICCLISIPLFYWFKPVKIAITKNNIDKSKDYILISLDKERIVCEIDEKGTIVSSMWDIIIRSHIQIIGNIETFDKLNSDVRDDRNIFVLYGRYVDNNFLIDNKNIKKSKDININVGETDKDVTIFYMEDWDILYPIIRQDDDKFMRFNPKWFLIKSDFNE